MVEQVANTFLLPKHEYDDMCRERLKLLRQVSNLKKKASVAHDHQVAAEARCKDAKVRAKVAECGLRRLQQSNALFAAALVHASDWENTFFGLSEDLYRKAKADASVDAIAELKERWLK